MVQRRSCLRFALESPAGTAEIREGTLGKKLDGDRPDSASTSDASMHLAHAARPERH